MKSPYDALITFYAKLAELICLTQDKLNALSWQVSPSRFYEWCISIIRKLTEFGAPTFDQPAWLGLIELLRERVRALDSSYTDTSLWQHMDRWAEFDYFAHDPAPSNPYAPKLGPYSKIVATYDFFEPIIKYATSALEEAQVNRSVDPVGRSMSVGDCAYVLWTAVRRACDNPWFRTQHQTVPKWTEPYAWLSWVENDLQELVNSLKDSDPMPGKPIGNTPWSMPPVR